MSRTAYDLAQTVVRQPLGPAERTLDVIPVPAPRQSVLKTLLVFIGWTLFTGAVLFAVVTLGSVWLMSSAARDIFTWDTKTTVVTGEAVVESIKQVNKQLFIEHYNAVDIDYTEVPAGWLGMLPIQQSFVVLLKGRVPAGFDLSQLSSQDIWISNDGRRIQLVLPPPQVFAENVNVDFENSRIFTQTDTCPEFICQDSLQAFQAQMLPQGRKLLIAASEQSGILEQAAKDGQLYYEQFLKSLGFAEVRVIVKGE